jgi:mono/diheme cytochrome c family protein
MSRRLLLSVFAKEDDLLKAAEAARREGLRIVDAYTPYAVHGLEKAMGLSPSRLSRVCLACGVVGALVAMWFQFWASSEDWPLNVGGRPWNSWPAFVPITFEMMVLLAAFGVVAAFFSVARLFPGKKPYIPLPGAADDRFILVIEESDAAFDAVAVRRLFERFHAVQIEEQVEGQRFEASGAAKGHRRLRLNIFLLVAFATVVALHFVLRTDPSQPNLEFLPDMAHGPRFNTFADNPNFEDGKTLQPPVPGTIARGLMPLHYEGTPESALRAGEELRNPIPLSDARSHSHGRKIFADFCQICHGADATGSGPMTKRGVPPPPSLLAEKARKMKDGQLFHILTFGQGNMASYAGQLAREERWYVINYIRGLQKSSTAEPPPILLPKTHLAETPKLFQANCAMCHGLDGTGNIMRSKLPTIPDFTNRAWHASQTDLEIVNRIQYGAIPNMPTFRYLLSREQMLALAVYVRGMPARSTPSAPSKTGQVAVRMDPVQIFRSYCFACHNGDGRGAIVRPAMPDIPDFTSAKWHATKPEAELVKAILSGGKFMPPMKDKLKPEEAAAMVRFVRGFQGGKQVVSLEVAKIPEKPVPIPQEILPKPIQTVTQPQPQPVPKVVPSTAKVSPPPEQALRLRRAAVLFRQFCIVCHGADGTGAAMRAQLPPIPDFTSGKFHAERTDPQLLISILDGKGTLMPANRGRITEEQARDLEAYVRSFGPPVVQARVAPPMPPGQFQRSFESLLQQWDALEKQLQSLSPPSGKR